MSANTDLWIEGNTRVRVSFSNMQPQISQIRPALLFNLEFNMVNPQGNPSPFNELTISDLLLELKQTGVDGKENFAGQLRLRSINRELSFHRNASATLIFELTPIDLRAIEKLRATQDLQLVISGLVSVEFHVQPRKIDDQYFTLNFRLSKSDWLEKYLPVLGFKTVSLIEIPQLLDSEFSDTINYVNDAWKQYSMGEYRKTFGDCRNAIECLGENIRNKGFEKQDISNGEKKSVPDWERFFDNQELGEVLATLNKKVFRLTSSGIHGASTRQIDREDADFALMTTHAIVNLVIHKFEQQQE